MSGFQPFNASIIYFKGFHFVPPFAFTFRPFGTYYLITQNEIAQNSSLNSHY